MWPNIFSIPWDLEIEQIVNLTTYSQTILRIGIMAHILLVYTLLRRFVPCCVLELRASPKVLSMWLQTVKFIVNKSKCAGLAQEIGFSAPNSCRLPWLVKGTIQLCTSKKECNKLDLIATQYFSLVNHNNWSRWFAISSPRIYGVLVIVLLVGLPKKEAELRHLILLSRVTYWAPVELL
jgi:hypothetical protein